MNTTDKKILGHVMAADFVGRAGELARVVAHAETPGGLMVLAAPGAGASELLRQAYDRLFTGGGEVIPFYFALSLTDRSPRETARRFLHDLLVQTVAFRRSDASILEASPELAEIAELAIPADGYWIDRLIEASRVDDETDERSFLRSSLSAPLRAAAHGARIFVMIDDLQNAASMSGVAVVFDELRDIYGNANVSHIFAGHRRFLFGSMAAETLNLGPLGFADAGLVADSLASRNGVAINDQTRDLLAVQLGGYPAAITDIFESAAEKGAVLDSFRRAETVYTDSIFGGRIGKAFDSLIARSVPDAVTPGVIELLVETADAAGGKAPIGYWKKRLGLAEAEFNSMMNLLNIHEIVSVNSGSVHAASANTMLADYVRGRMRLEIAGEARALVVGEALTEYLKRAPQMLARYYRRMSALGLRSLLGAFDCQQVAAAAIDYAKFKADLKGLADENVREHLDAATETVTLPQIVYTAHTAAFYSKIGELIDDERSTIALGFEENDYLDETVWIAAEIDSKLEATGELTQFWLDRLEMVAINCGFPNYLMWLVAPEGFADDALETLRERGAFGSSRRQVELLAQKITGGPLTPPTTNGDEYEIIIPMGDDTEMIAAHAVEEIARRHKFPAKAINQIKTALVEACINATEHSLSPDRRIYQKFVVDAEKITITVANRGLRLLDKTAREIAPDEGRRGWGLKLMKGLMDDVKIEQSDDGTRVTMTKYHAIKLKGEAE